MIMVCQCRFIDCNKCTTVEGCENKGGVAGGEAVPIWRTGCNWEIYVPASQLFCEPKTNLKNKVYL